MLITELYRTVVDDSKLTYLKNSSVHCLIFRDVSARTHVEYANYVFVPLSRWFVISIFPSLYCCSGDGWHVHTTHVMTIDISISGVNRVSVYIPISKIYHRMFFFISCWQNTERHQIQRIHRDRSHYLQLPVASGGIGATLITSSLILSSSTHGTYDDIVVRPVSEFITIHNKFNNIRIWSVQRIFCYFLVESNVIILSKVRCRFWNKANSFLRLMAWEISHKQMGRKHFVPKRSQIKTSAELLT